MSTRQLRLNSLDLFRSKLPGFIGQQINVIRRDATVLLVTLESIDGEVLNTRNMRLKRVAIPLKDISEIYFDTKE